MSSSLGRGTGGVTGEGWNVQAEYSVILQPVNCNVPPLLACLRGGRSEAARPEGPASSPSAAEQRGSLRGWQGGRRGARPRFTAA